MAAAEPSLIYRQVADYEPHFIPKGFHLVSSPPFSGLNAQKPLTEHTSKEMGPLKKCSANV